MDPKVEQVLEFDKVKEMLAQRASFSLGKKLALELHPTSDPQVVRRWQQQTSEARRIMDESGTPPFGGITDISPILKKARVGSTITPAEFVDLQAALSGMNRMRQFIATEASNCPLIKGQGERINDFTALEREIGKTIGEEGEVLDSASPELARVRSQINTYQNRIRDKLESIIRSPKYGKILQNPIITIRNGRYVVPVKSEQKSSFQGIVHDQSGSGQTVFIEPQAVVELNNRLRELEAAEKDEVQRILRQLTEKVRVHYSDLEEALDALAQLDLVFAKARMAEETDATAPLLNERGYIKIYGGRHPLLTGKVVPIDVWLGDEFHMLVITGPNTGGKTVTLKTIGLFTLMAQAGLHVPAETGTELAIFSSVFADIGDEQSIEQSLSTFSSHMAKIVRIIDSASDNSLVLLDELGAGTDPTEGAALAIAILKTLLSRRCRTVATTHYSELKTFAYTTEGIENASVEFDVETLRPTYKLSIGLPGRSNAFLIARRLGLDESIIEQARAMLSKEHERVEDLIREIEEDRRQTIRDRSEAARLKKELAQKVEDYEKRLQRLDSEKDSILAAARREAEEVVSQARQEADQLLGKLRRAGRHDLEDTAKTVRTQLDARRSELERTKKKKAKEDSKSNGPRKLRPGEIVRVLSLDQQGQVLEVKGQEVVVQAGILRITVPRSDLEKTEEAPVQVQKGNKRSSSVSHQKTIEVSTELHLRGMRVDEALARLDKYLDDAILAGMKKAKIVHGKGTGTLRRAVHEELRKHPRVASYRLGGPGEGSYGVTIVELK